MFYLLPLVKFWSLIPQTSNQQLHWQELPVSSLKSYKTVSDLKLIKNLFLNVDYEKQNQKNHNKKTLLGFFIINSTRESNSLMGTDCSAPSCPVKILDSSVHPSNEQLWEACNNHIYTGNTIPKSPQ